MDKPPTVKIWDTWSQMSFFVDNAAHTSSPPDAGATRYPVCDCAERADGSWQLLFLLDLDSTHSVFARRFHTHHFL